MCNITQISLIAPVCVQTVRQLSRLCLEINSLWFLSLVSVQERTRSFDGFNMNPLESSLIDIMRAEQDTLKGEGANCHSHI